MNKTVLLGRIVKDPNLTFAAGKGTAICRFTLAVNRMKKDDGADFINCIAFGKSGETISQYVTKGQQLAISGRIQTGSYDAKDGTKRYTTDVVVDGFDFIGSKKEGQPNNSFAPVDDFSGMSEDMDGDIPF